MSFRLYMYIFTCISRLFAPQILFLHIIFIIAYYKPYVVNMSVLGEKVRMKAPFYC